MLKYADRTLVEDIIRSGLDTGANCDFKALRRRGWLGRSGRIERVAF